MLLALHLNVAFPLSTETHLTCLSPFALAVKCCSLFDSLQLIAHNLFRFQDAPFINDDIFQKAVQLAALHTAYIFHISKTGHMQNHFTVAQTQER